MKWAFWRKPKPAHVGPTSVDWKPGDMAECVERLDRRFPAPKIGDRLLVTAVFYGDAKASNARLFGLSFVGWPNDAFAADAFRKVILTDTGTDRKVGKRAPTRVAA